MLKAVNDLGNPGIFLSYSWNEKSTLWCSLIMTDAISWLFLDVTMLHKEVGSSLSRTFTHKYLILGWVTFVSCSYYRSNLTNYLTADIAIGLTSSLNILLHIYVYWFFLTFTFLFSQFCIECIIMLYTRESTNLH